MTLLVQRVEIHNFKAFRNFAFDLEGRHLLVYGPNGSGKSSLYWALFTFLQSARKPANGVSKYFEPGNSQSLLNLFEQGDTNPIPGEIAMTLRDPATKTDTVYRISQTAHETHNQPAILKGDLASDFVTYRFFFGFAHFRNSQQFNLWPIFEQEILPFCVSTGETSPHDCWKSIDSATPNPSAYRGLAGAHAYSAFRRRVAEFAAMLPGIIDSISIEAQRFYDEHFAAGDPARIDLRLGLTTPPQCTGGNRDDFVFTRPVIEFAIRIGGKQVNRPQVFLNEAKLTQLALAVRFAASLVNLHQSDLKLLVLDDLLVSLDMSNRMKVVEILLSDQFVGYQKIILTHELGFFREFRRKVGNTHPDWCFLRLQGDARSKIEAINEKTDIQKAEDYLHGRNLDEAAVRLRKAAEDMGRRWREWADKKAIPPGMFFTLGENLRAAKKQLLLELPMEILEKVVEPTPAAHRGLLVPTSDSDIEGNQDLDAAAKGILKSKRKLLRAALTTDHSKRLNQIKLIEDILACTDRVLNPAAHSGDPPLYEKEVEDALALIKQLDTTLV